MTFYLSIANTISLVFLPYILGLAPYTSLSWDAVARLLGQSIFNFTFSFLFILLPCSIACGLLLWPILFVRRVDWLGSLAPWYVYARILGVIAGLISMRFAVPMLELVDSEGTQTEPATPSLLTFALYFGPFCLAGVASARHILKIAGLRKPA